MNSYFRLSVTFAMIWCSLPLFARNFEYTYEGQTLTYTVLDDASKTVKTKDGADLYSSGNSVSGDLIIPSVVYDGDTEYKVTGVGQYAFNDCSELTSVEIPNSVISVGNNAFFNCLELKSLTISESITSIGSWAFAGCTSLASIEIPSTVTLIDSWTFAGCSKLAELVIPESVTSIGDAAFYSCSGLTSVKIGNSVTSIGGHAFDECSRLTSIDIPASVISIGVYAFANCSRMTSIGVSDDNPAYASYDGLLLNKDRSSLLLCPGGLATVEIPSSVKAISDLSFFRCAELITVKIPSSVETIGRAAFAGCKKLTAIYSCDITPPAAFANTFDDVPVEAVINVPSGRASAYSEAEGWKVFQVFHEMDTLTVTLDKSSLNMKPDDTETLSANLVNPDNVEIISEEWTSTNPSVATVDNGTVTAISAGKATISYIVTDESGFPYYASCEITVTPTDSIDSILTDNNTEVEIFTLQGIKLSRRECIRPGIYIAKSGNQSHRILVK